MEKNLVLLAKELRDVLPTNVMKNVKLVLTQLDLENGSSTETIRMVVKSLGKDIEIASLSYTNNDTSLFWFAVNLEIDSSKIYCLPSEVTQICSGDLEILMNWENKDLLVREFKFNYKDVEDKIYPENFA